MNKKSVLIIGGHGTFGKLIADQLVGLGDIKIAGRSKKAGQLFAKSIGAEFIECNTNDGNSLKRAAAGVYLVINASGPFYAEDYLVPRICIEEGCHYIDLADGRDYLAGFDRLGEAATTKGVFACTGASTTPAVTSALAFEIIPQTSADLRSIDVFLSVGNKNKPGLSTLESILSYVGTPLKVWNHNQWEQLPGWGQPEYFDFPSPVGRRRVHLCSVPDLEIFPKLFRAERIMFKAGVELDIFNFALSILASTKKLFPSFHLQSLGKILLWLSGYFQPWGTDAGGVTVVVEDKQGMKRSRSFVAAENGRRIPTSPAVLLARKILQDGHPAIGAFPCVNLIELREFRDFLEPFGIEFKS